MKKTVVIFLLAHLFAVASFANAWERVYQDDPQSNWSAIHFVNDSVAYAGNQAGEIYYTMDRGASWSEIFNSIAAIKGFSFPNDTIAFAAADGYNPSLITIDLRSNVVSEDVQMINSDLLAVHFVDDKKGLSISNLQYKKSWSDKEYKYKRYIKRTSDGGKTWSYAKQIDVDSKADFFVDLAFANADTGIAIAENRMLYRTTDGGTTWTEKTLMHGELRKAAFCNDSCAIIIGNDGVVWYSYDSGLKWFNKSIDTELDLANVAVIDDSSYLVVTSNVDWKAYKSMDCGQTWSEVTTLPASRPYPLSCEVVGERLYMGCKTGIMTQTTHDFARLDTLIGTRANGVLRNMHFVDKNTGWAVGSKSLLYTQDGGCTWTPSDAITETMYDVCGIDASNVVAVGSKGYMFLSHNGGESWEKKKVGSYQYDAVSFKGAFGLAVGQSCELVVTRDSGATWTSHEPDRKESLNDVKVISDSSAIAVGDDGLVLCTTDTGATWTSKVLGDGYDDFNRLSFVNALEGYAIGENTTKTSFLLYRTFDGGQHWLSMSGEGIEKEDDYELIAFASAAEGWIAGSYGLMYTNDSCSTWSLTEPGSVVDIHVVDAKNAYALISGNKIIKYALPADSFNVTFQVSDEQGQLLDSVCVVIDSDTLSLNSLTFSAEEDMTYAYTVGRAGYYTSEGTMTLTKDSILTIELEKIVEAALLKQACATIEARIYPNPTTDYVRVSTENPGFSTLIYSMAGQLLLAHTTADKQALIDLSDLSSGLYFVKIQQNGLAVSRKLIKQ